MMKREAVIEGNYRYSLLRDWSEGISQVLHKRALFIMLNPSTADAFEDDRTTNRCIDFAKQFNCTSLEIINLFAYISTDWTKVKNMGRDDAVGPKNDEYIREALNNCNMVIAAWGDEAITHKSDRHIELITSVLNGYRKPIYCLGKTTRRQPRHPLFLAKETKSEVFM